MTVKILADWKSSHADLPDASKVDAADNIAGWVSDNIVGMILNGMGGAGLSFTFNESAFSSAILALPPIAPDAITGITGFADALVTAISSSTIAVIAGSYIGSPLPATTFSVVTTTLFDPPSILAMKAKIIELASVDPATIETDDDSPFPEKFREAILLLTISTTGLDSTPTPAGPLPLVDLLRSVA